MDRRRAGRASALLRRVRWGNVGRLAALLAAGLLIASEVRACGRPEALPAGDLPRAQPRRG
ncbi:MAG: hypothetical protein ACRDL4_06660, partial [Thermoleophilaceae bacterium]